VEEGFEKACTYAVGAVKALGGVGGFSLRDRLRTVDAWRLKQQHSLQISTALYTTTTFRLGDRWSPSEPH
jgi:hypothetical protein